MNKKAQIGVGGIVTIAIGVIVALILLQAVATQTKAVDQNTVVVNNLTIASPAIGVVYELAGQELLSAGNVYNISNASNVVETGNYSISECVRTSNNLKGICYKTLGAAYASSSVNVSYNYKPDGYMDDAGGRAIAGIIVLLAALGIAIWVFGGVRMPE